MMDDRNLIGRVQSVDTGNAIVKVDTEELLNSVQVNQIVQMRSTRTNERIIGLVSKIMRKAVADKADEESEPDSLVENIIKVNLIGTLRLKEGTQRNRFRRTLDTVPSIDADCYLLHGRELSEFMDMISADSTNPLTIGRYAISSESVAKIDGNRFFQRHAVIVGGTGSGKSWTVANILEQASKLKSVNCIVFDLHGEYSPLREPLKAMSLKIAGPSDNPGDNIMFLPYWLLSYGEMESLLLDRSDNNAPNQARALFDQILECKKAHYNKIKGEAIDDLTVESPIPYKISDVLSSLEQLDVEVLPNGRTTRQGTLNGKLTRLIQRLRSKTGDKRLNFLFNTNEKLLDFEWLNELAHQLLDFGNERGLKILDFSEVPSDLLPLCTGIVARLIFSLQLWMEENERHPIALFCDEAHLYLPSTPRTTIEEKGLHAFERIAKEGRKYGISLVVITQRPSDLNNTILSQCGNFVAMRLTNQEDQNVVKRLFPDNLGNIADLLPILDIGEGLVVGDASLLPTRVIFDEPRVKPKSATINFWDEWGEEKTGNGIEKAVAALRIQRK